MRNQVKNLVRTMYRAAGLFAALGSVMMASAQERCIKVDLQAVSIDPIPAMIQKGQTATIVVTMKNNGPCPIPKTEATAQVTLNGDALDLGTPLNFIDICGQWSYLGVISENGQHNLFFQNNEGAIPNGDIFCSFQFDVKANALVKDPSLVTMHSTLSATATTADLDGNNQAARTEVKISATAQPVVLSEINVSASECNAVISWRTSSEKNITGFEVEQSTDGYQFSPAGTVAAKNASGGSSYEYIHNQGPGKAFYRIKANGKNGPLAFSKLVILDNKCAPKKSFMP